MLRVKSKSGQNMSKKRKVQNENDFHGRTSRKLRKEQHEVDAARREERRLEKVVLGGGCGNMLDSIDGRSQFEEGSRMVAENRGNEDSGVEEGEGYLDSDNGQLSDTLTTPERQPAWQDEADADITIKTVMETRDHEFNTPWPSSEGYTTILKHKFESIMGKPKWAELGSKTRHYDSDDDSDHELLRHCGNFLAKKSQTLRKGTMNWKRLRDLNRETYSEGPILKAAQFHPSSTVGLVAGVAGVASIFQVDGRNNTKLQSVQFERFPIHCARFSRCGGQFLVGSQSHSHFYCYDMMVGESIRIANNHSEMGSTSMKNFEMSPDGHLIAVCGKFGNIYLLTALTKEYVATLKMNGEVTAVTFNADGSRMFSYGDAGEVYVWDMSARACVHRFTDDGCLSGTSLAMSPSDQLLACGSSSGVVNIYDTSTVVSCSAPRPIKVVLNIRTPITSLKFNCSSELLAMGSWYKDNAFRLMHFPSTVVYKNIPGFNLNLSRPQCVDFSLNSGYITISNNRNAALLFRLNHYDNY